MGRFSMHRRWADVPQLVVCVSTGFVLWSCAALQRERTDPSSPVVALNVLSTPAPTAEGFGVNVFAHRKGETKASPIVDGSLEVKLFDGLASGDDAGALEPLASWTYSAEDLLGREHRSYLGVSYGLRVQWGRRKPSARHVTISVRYIPPQGQAVVAPLTSLLVAP